MKFSKNIFFLIFTAVFLYSCNSGQIRIKKDKFSNSSVLSMTLVHFSDSFFAGRLDATYLREFTQSGPKPISMRLKISAPTNYDFPNEDLQIKINDQIYKASTGNISGEIHTNIDNNGYATQYKVFNATVYFDQDIENGINSAESFAYKISLGIDKPTIYTVKKEEIKKLQAFLNARPDDQGLVEENSW